MVQALEAGGVARVELRQHSLQGSGRFRRAGQGGQCRVQGCCLAARLALVLQCGKARTHFTEPGIAADAENVYVVHRADGEAVIVVLDVERTALDIQVQRQVAGLQDAAIVAGQEWQQQLALQQGVGGVPFDVEEFGIGAAPTPFEQVQPPGVVHATHGHVVGHDIEDQAHAVQAQRGHQAFEGRFAAKLRVDAGRVHHIVAMHRARPRLEQRRGIEMADAQCGEVRHQRHGIVQGEIPVEL
ncbi:hypothetical protein D9M71_113440 [compost metagenome]